MESAKKILVVEDEKEQRDVLVASLTQEGFTVLEATTGAEGLEMAFEHKPDLILLDIRMPEMTGFEMLKRLRARGDWGAHVPAIFLTNIEPTSDEERTDIEATEPLHYFVKSDIALYDLVAKIKELIGT